MDDGCILIYLYRPFQHPPQPLRAGLASERIYFRSRKPPSVFSSWWVGQTSPLAQAPVWRGKPAEYHPLPLSPQGNRAPDRIQRVRLRLFQPFPLEQQAVGKRSTGMISIPQMFTQVLYKLLSITGEHIAPSSLLLGAMERVGGWRRRVPSPGVDWLTGGPLIIWGPGHPPMSSLSIWVKKNKKTTDLI